MKKILGIVIAVIVVVVILALLGTGLGFGFGSGNGSGDGDGEGTRSNNSSALSEETDGENTKATVAETIDANVDDTESSAENGSEMITIAVSVFESDYFYQNKKISLDDFIKELESIEENFVVEVTDDNASLKAYNKLIDALEDRRISYTEK